ncbi:thioredoxin-like domain-containing protein [Caulifigura coniformis]|nr:thioredoxin-like domain-containing protein [Caulifigura coniformis]
MALVLPNPPVHSRRYRGRAGRALVVALVVLCVTGSAILPGFMKAQDAPQNPLPGRFPAPSLDGGVEWLNTSGPIDLKDLRGKIVLLDFWTYCCINCIHVLPDLKYLEKKYDKQLVVIGVHAAKFSNEKETENIRRAILRYEIEHPVINDANMVIARKYQFSSWPTLVLIDPEGNFVGQQPGEGHREIFDEVIGKMVAFHRAKGTLDETPVKFALERHQAPITPLRFPGKLLADAANDRLYVSDSNHNRIVISTLQGDLVDVIGTGAIGKNDGDYAVATFDHPQGMTLVGDTLYVADTENHMIRAVDVKRRTVSTFSGTGEQARLRSKGGALTKTALNSPWALTHLDGVLYVAMAGPHQLWSHKLGTNRIEVFAGSGREDILDGTRDDAALAQPSGITTDGQSLFFVDSEGSAVRKVSRGSSGRVVTIVGPHDFPQGRSLFEFGDIDGAADDVRLQHPLGVVFHEGALFVADTYNHKIKRVDPKTRDCETWLGAGKRGQGLDPVELSEPADMLIVGDRMIVADTNNHRLLSVDMKSRHAEEFIIKGLAAPPPPKIESDADEASGKPVTDLAETTVKSSGPLEVEATFTLPEGFKLNTLAPQTVRLSSPAGQGLVAAEHLDSKLEAMIDGNAVRWTIPISGSGQATFELTLSYSYCRDGTGGVCKFGTARWRLPVRATAEAPASKVSLKVDPSAN